jgi:hypothetical protein
MKLLRRLPVVALFLSKAAKTMTFVVIIGVRKGDRLSKITIKVE